MPGTYTIIQADESYVDFIAPLFDAYRQFYEQAPDLALARTFIAERLRNQESIIYLALSDSERELVALGFTQLYPTFSSIGAKRLWILNDLYVIPESRGKGIGQALLQRAKDLAMETEARGLTLATAVDNPAQHLYEKVGYVKDVGFFHYFLAVDDGKEEL